MEDEETLDPVGFARRHELDCWFSVPSVVGVARRLKRLGEGSLPHLRLSLFCGEALPTSVAAEWSRVAPNSRILNLYGPTEATIAITAHEYGRNAYGELATVPLGAAFPQSAAVAERRGRRRSGRRSRRALARRRADCKGLYQQRG